MLNYLRNRLLGVLLNAPTAEQILRIDKNQQVWVGGTKLTPEQSTNLAQEAHYIANSELWGIITSTLLQDANEKMITKSKSWDDVWAGKLINYCISVQNKIIELARNQKVK